MQYHKFNSNHVQEILFLLKNMLHFLTIEIPEWISYIFFTSNAHSLIQNEL